MGFIQELIALTTPLRKPKPPGQRHWQDWWTPAIDQAVERERKAHRQWANTHTDQAWEDYTTASKAKREQIAKAKQAHWRNKVHEAAESPEGVWKLAKWACTRGHLPPEPAKLLDIN